MATTPPFFDVDPTGEAKANRRLREPHVLQDTTTNYVRALSLDMGCFFIDSVKVYDKVTGIELKPEIDYIFTEYYTSLSTIYKKDIAGTLIITNPQVNREIEVSYNFLGTLFGNTVKGISNTINAEANRRQISNLQWEMLNNAKPILPHDYARQVGTGIGFETITFALERIRSTIMYGDFDTEMTIGQFIDQFLLVIEEMLDSRVKNEFKKELDEFRDSFTKELLGLDKVVNMAPIDPEMAKLAVVRDFIFDKNKDGYVTIKAISRFKEELYNNLVSKNKTSIGRYQGTYGLPLLTTIYALRNGDGFIIDSLNTSKVAGYDFNNVVYPDPASPDDRWAITKITNNLYGQGGVLWGSNMTTGELYVGQLKNGIDEPNVLSWTKLYSEFDMERALTALTDHTTDIENPHWVNKHQLLLGNVENYPVADADDLACRVPAKKYVTHAWVLAFLSTYMNGLKTAEDLQKMNCDENEVIRNIKLIFAPCGPCGPCCEPNLVPVTTTTTQRPIIVDPEGQLTSWFCENNKRWDVITDGKGGTKTVEHKYAENDPDIEKDGCVRSISTTSTRAPTTSSTTTSTSTTTTSTSTTTTTTSAPVDPNVILLDTFDTQGNGPIPLPLHEGEIGAKYIVYDDVYKNAEVNKGLEIVCHTGNFQSDSGYSIFIDGDYKQRWPTAQDLIAANQKFILEFEYRILTPHTLQDASVMYFHFPFAYQSVYFSHDVSQSEIAIQSEDGVVGTELTPLKQNEKATLQLIFNAEQPTDHTLETISTAISLNGVSSSTDLPKSILRKETMSHGGVEIKLAMDSYELNNGEARIVFDKIKFYLVNH